MTAVNRVLKKRDESEGPAEPLKQAEPAAVIERERVELPPLDFATGKPVEIKRAAETPNPVEKPRPVAIVETVLALENPAHQRTRDAYIAARFPGVAKSSSEFSRVRAVIKAAQVYFDDGNARRAEELLDLASELIPASEALPLARLELALRQSDSESYRRTAIRFRKDHPRSARWKEIVAFARTMYLTEAPFTPDPGDGDSDRRYLRPNWLQDSFELAPEFNPADLRARVLAIDNDLQKLEKEAA
jgi:hypothetical protein